MWPSCGLSTGVALYNKTNIHTTCHFRVKGATTMEHKNYKNTLITHYKLLSCHRIIMDKTIRLEFPSNCLMLAKF